MASSTPTLVDDDLAAAIGADRAAQWGIDRGPQRPSIRVAHLNGRPVAALLTTRRPATLATKIAHVWRAADDPEADDALARLVQEEVADAERRGDLAVKWQCDDDVAPPESLGFTRMRTPYRSGAGTEGTTTGHIRWLRETHHVEPPYYSQTSSFSCGAVTALLASEIRGSGGFADGADNRDIELDFWRRASNYPTCEPVGLAVALRESFADDAGRSPVEVFLDTEGPVLLESYSTRFDRAFRAELQEHSLHRARASDVAVRRDRVGVEQIAARIRGGELALLLIDLEPMYGFSVPHWVLAHAATDDAVLVQDPWISANWGETWVDAHEVPIALPELDRMLAWGEERYRGVVFVRGA